MEEQISDSDILSMYSTMQCLGRVVDANKRFDFIHYRLVYERKQSPNECFR